MNKYLRQTQIARITDYPRQVSQVVQFLIHNRSVIAPPAYLQSIYQLHPIRTVITDLFDKCVNTGFIDEFATIKPVRENAIETFPDLLTLTNITIDLKNDPAANALKPYYEVADKILINVSSLVKDDPGKSLIVSDINELHSMYVRGMLVRSFAMSNGWLTPTLCLFLIKTYSLAIATVIGKNANLIVPDQVLVGSVFALYMSQMLARSDEDITKPRIFYRCNFLGTQRDLDDIAIRAASLAPDGLNIPACCQLITELGPQRLQQVTPEIFYRSCKILGFPRDELTTNLAFEYPPYWMYLVLQVMANGKVGALPSVLKQNKLFQSAESKRFTDELVTCRSLYENRKQPAYEDLSSTTLTYEDDDEDYESDFEFTISNLLHDQSIDSLYGSEGFLDAVKSASDYIIDKIKAFFSWLWKKIKFIWGKIVEFLKRMFGKAENSKETLKENVEQLADEEFKEKLKIFQEFLKEKTKVFINMDTANAISNIFIDIDDRIVQLINNTTDYDSLIADVKEAGSLLKYMGNRSLLSLAGISDELLEFVALKNIKPGETKSYNEIANELKVPLTTLTKQSLTENYNKLVLAMESTAKVFTNARFISDQDLSKKENSFIKIIDNLVSTNKIQDEQLRSRMNNFVYYECIGTISTLSRIITTSVSSTIAVFNEILKQMNQIFNTSNNDVITTQNLKAIEQQFTNLHQLFSVNEYPVYAMQDVLKVIKNVLPETYSEQIANNDDPTMIQATVLTISETNTPLIMLSTKALTLQKKVQEVLAWHEYGHIRHGHAGIRTAKFIRTYITGKGSKSRYIKQQLGINRPLSEEIQADCVAVEHVDIDAVLTCLRLLKPQEVIALTKLKQLLLDYEAANNTKLGITVKGDSDSRILYFEKWKREGKKPSLHDFLEK